MDYAEKIMQMAKLGPLQPTQVATALGTNSLMASAMLSDLASKGKLKISFIKVGSSPLYYAPETEAMLQNYAYALNEKDRKTYELLKEKKILREAELEPLTRVSVRQLKDFAKPLEVSFNNQKEIFWKWHVLPDDEAEQLIKNMLRGPEQKTQEHTPKTEQEKTSDTQTEHAKAMVETSEDPEISGTKRIDEKKSKKPQKKLVEAKTEEKHEQKKEELLFGKEEKPFVDTTAKNTLIAEIREFFKNNSISITEQLPSQKKTEYDFIIEINSAVGPLAYYCKATSKKRISEADISAAFVNGQLKKLPVVLLVQGELTKQARQFAQQLKGITIKKI